MPASISKVVRKNHGNKIARRSSDFSLAFKPIFSTFQQIWQNMERKSLNGGHATVGQLSTNYFRRFMEFGIVSKKVFERSRDSDRRSRYRLPTTKKTFFDVSSNSRIF